MLSVKMLGGLTFTHAGTRVATELGSSGRLLAAYLLEFPDRVHRRERLAETFWSDLEPNHARAALNTALWRFRKLLAHYVSETPSVLYTSGAEVVLESTDSLCVDTHAFLGATQKALLEDRHDVRCSADMLNAAVDGYLGEFLDGEEADWVIAERERLHSLYIRCLIQLVRLHFVVGEYERAISSARRVLAVDAYRESVQRALALLLVVNGQRAQAIRELRRWAVDIKREIGVGHMPETTKLENAIVTGKIFEDLPNLTRFYFGLPAESREMVSP